MDRVYVVVHDEPIRVDCFHDIHNRRSIHCIILYTRGKFPYPRLRLRKIKYVNV